MTLAERFKKHIKDTRGTTLLTVSGGMDSMAMADLYLAAGLPFAVAHCNFQLRGAEADMDEQLVREWCQLNNIVFHSTRFDTKVRSQEWKKGTQETARILRYEWFEQLRTEHGYYKIATAHHANDNAETLLINLFKGTGISGLHGILADSGNLIRPLLFATRSEISDYVTENDIRYREDASNASEDYLRNAVRRSLVPEIERLFPHAVRSLNESIHRFAEAEMLYKKAIEAERKKLIEQRGLDHYIPIRKLQKREAVSTILYELLLPFGFSPAQAPQVMSLLDAETGHYVASGTHRVIKNREFLVITPAKQDETQLVLVEAAPCIIDTGRYRYSFSIQEKPAKITSDADTAMLDMKQITFPLILRKWKTGDYLYPLGMDMKKKKVSRILINEKIALHDKEHVWVLECKKRIAWLCGIRLDERFKIKPLTEKVLVVKRSLVATS